MSVRSELLVGAPLFTSAMVPSRTTESALAISNLDQSVASVSADPAFDAAAPGAIAPEVTRNRFRKRLAIEGIATVGLRIAGIGTAITVDVAISRNLTPSDAGVFFLLATTLSFCAMMATFGLTAAMTRFVSEGLGRQNSEGARRSMQLGSRIAMVSIPITAISCAALVYFGGARIFHIPVSAVLSLLLALCVFALPVLQLTANLLRSFHKSGLATLLTGQSGGPVVNLLFLSTILVYACFARPTLLTAIALNAAALCSMAPLAILILRQISKARLGHTSPELDRRSTPTLALFMATCFPLCLSQFFSYCTGFGDMWIAGSFVAHDQLALYAAARRLMLFVGLPLQFVNLIVVASIAELRAQGKTAELQRILRTFATVAAIPAGLALIVLLAAPGLLASLLFGAFYAKAGGVLVILCVGQIVYVFAGSAELTLMMTGNQRAALGVNALTSVLLAIVGIPVARNFGIQGLAIVSSAVIATQVIAFSLCVRRSLGVWTVVDPFLLYKLRGAHRNWRGAFGVRTP